MKKSVLSGSLVLVLLCLGFPQGACSQTYYYSGGGAEQTLAYSDFGSPQHGGTYRWLDLGPFNETFYLDPVANTLQVVGSVSINNPTGYYQYSDSFGINANTSVPSTVTV